MEYIISVLFGMWISCFSCLFFLDKTKEIKEKVIYPNEKIIKTVNGVSDTTYIYKF